MPFSGKAESGDGHGSIFLNPTQPITSALNPTRPTTLTPWTQPKPTYYRQVSNQSINQSINLYRAISTEARK